MAKRRDTKDLIEDAESIGQRPAPEPPVEDYERLLNEADALLKPKGGRRNTDELLREFGEEAPKPKRRPSKPPLTHRKSGPEVRVDPFVFGSPSGPEPPADQHRQPPPLPGGRPSEGPPTPPPSPSVDAEPPTLSSSQRRISGRDGGTMKLEGWSGPEMDAPGAPRSSLARSGWWGIVETWVRARWRWLRERLS